MKKPFNINQLFTKWGQGERELPARVDELKKTIIARMPDDLQPVSMPAYRLPWLSFAFGGLAVLMLFVGSVGKNTLTAPSATAPEMAVSRAGVAIDGDMSVSNQNAMMPDYYPRPWQDPNVPITDTREFLQTTYNASIRTRNVQELTRRAETTVRGFGGRVDSSNTSEKWGSVSFALPAAKFEAFRDEIESFVGSRFITIETQTQNLLPQKQSIEEQKKQIEKNAADFRAQRKTLIANHNATLVSLQAQINALAPELTAEKAALQARINSENASYIRQLNSIDSMIKDTESGLEWVSKQDTTLLDNVATVRGTISLSWISIWDAVQLYISAGWLAFLFVIAAVSSYRVRLKLSQR